MGWDEKVQPAPRSADADVAEEISQASSVSAPPTMDSLAKEIGVLQARLAIARELLTENRPGDIWWDVRRELFLEGEP